MKNISLMIGVLAGSFVALSCRQGAAAAPAPAGADTVRSLLFTGTVTEVLSSGGYTYLQLSGDGRKVWAACPPVDVKTGEVVVTPPGLLMKDFSSKTLNRKFDAIFFVDGIQRQGIPAATDDAACPVASKGGMPAGHGMAKTVPTVLSFENLKRAEGGRTVAELYAEKAQWSGKTVAVRGRVAKFTPSIMDRNWIHIQDGTGEGATRDLTATSTNVVKVGDRILAAGVVATNKVFGHGYSYGVLMENAQITIESP